MRGLVRWLLRTLLRVRVSGALAGGPQLLVAHAESALDGVLLALLLPREPLLVPTPEMLRTWWPRLLLRCVPHVVVEAADAQRLRAVVRHVRGGGVAVIFPQGRVSSNGSPMQVLEAAGLLAGWLDNVVVPVDVNGTLYEAFLDAAALYGRRKRIIEDARREPETYGKLLKAALALGRLLERETMPRETVGILMPSISTTIALLFGLTARGARVRHA